MFHSKSRTDQLQETLQENTASLASTAATVAEQLRERVVPAVGQAAGSAVEWGQPRVEAARLWARPRVEHGIEVAAPKLESVVSSLGPKVDTARDKIVDDLLPRLNEAIATLSAASVAAKDEAVSRGTGAAAVLSGDATASPKCKKKRMVLLILGLFAAAAAGAATIMKRSAPKDDPWATPVGDPYVEPSAGRHSSVVPVDDATDATDPADGTAATDLDADADAVIFDPLDATEIHTLDAAEKADPDAERDGGSRE